MIYSIQFSRALAAFAVVYFHIAHHAHVLPQFGAFGVDLFFVISGFIMAKVMVESPEKFFAKRLIRIVPLYWMFTFLVFILALIYPSQFKTTVPSFENLFKSLFFIPYDSSNGVIKPLYFIGWSLNYEVFFYVACAISLLFFRDRVLLRVISILIFIVYLVSASISVDNVTSRFLGDTIILEFLIGVLIYKYKNFVSSISVDFQKYLIILAVLAFATLIFVDWMIYTGTTTVMLLPRILTLGLPAGIFVFSILRLEHNFSDKDAIRLLGDSTYSIYLIHPLVIEIIYFATQRFLASHKNSLLLALLTFAICAVAGIICHRQVEKPVLALFKR